MLAWYWRSAASGPWAMYEDFASCAAGGRESFRCDVALVVDARESGRWLFCADIGR